MSPFLPTFGLGMIAGAATLRLALWFAGWRCSLFLRNGTAVLSKRGVVAAVVLDEAGHCAGATAGHVDPANRPAAVRTMFGVVIQVAESWGVGPDDMGESCACADCACDDSTRSEPN